MKISFSWLKNYCSTTLSAQEVSAILTSCGLEVESMEKFESVRGGLKGIVVGEVKTKIKHPNADKLSLTTVDIGKEELLSIVCGGPNVAAGQKVLIATTGSTLYPIEGEPFEIKKSKIRGEISDGMICAEDEIGLGRSHEGVMVLDPSAKTGTPASEYFQITEDVIFEIGLTPNRVDASSHIGVARDLLAVINSQNHLQKALELKIPSVENFKIDSEKLKIGVEIEDGGACPRYSGISISGVTVGESPAWLKDRLRSIGVKPINNIVDITNFILQECGQPLHAFDADEIAGGKIVVKKWKEGTKFTSLDGVERTLASSDLMISNTQEGMCIAGVFGGMKSGIQNTTRNIFIESAYFDPSGIRRTSAHHGLKTDAAFRYERGADPEITVFALKRAAMLIKEVAGGEISSHIVDVYPNKVPAFQVPFSINNFEKLGGVKIDHAIIKSILNSLGILILSSDKDEWQLEVPRFKPDVKREADITEEVLRIYGYDKIPLPEKLRAPVVHGKKPDKEKILASVSAFLSNNGFSEIITNSLTKENSANSIRLSNPLSEELAFMRQSMLAGGLEVIAYNRNRKQQDLKLFEFGKTYHWKNSEKEGKKGMEDFYESSHLVLYMTGRKFSESWNAEDDKVNFFYLKSFVENCLKRAGVNGKVKMKEAGGEIFSEGLSYSYSSEVVKFGKVKTEILKKADAGTEVYFADFNWDAVLRLVKKDDLLFKEINKFPEVRRDLSMLIDKKIQYAELEKLAYETEKNVLRNVSLFDVFEGEKIGADKKSYAMSFTLQDDSKTLTDKEVDKVIDKFITAFETKFGAAVRK